MAVKLNGIAVPEAGFNAAIAGDFGVPVVFVSGDQVIGNEATRLLGPIETVAVKQAIGFHAAVMISPEKAEQLIRGGVKRAIIRRGEIKPYRMTRPVSLEVRFKDPIAAELVSYLPEVQRPTGDTIVFSARNMTQASQFLEAISSISVKP
jgi:D-amino peptidase